MKDRTVFVIVGPTAVGKTSAAIHLAKYLQTKIISADSRQCFKELDIAVAKPSPEELQAVPHYFINSHSINEEVNAGMFEQLSLQWAEEIFKEKRSIVMVGGTGLYIKAFCEGLDEMPVINPSIRQKIQDHYLQEGLVWLQQEVKVHDPLFYESGEIQNPQRMMRALEIKLSTGRSILDFRSHQKRERPFHIKKMGLHLPKEVLHENINMRVDQMVERGLVAEATNLLPFKNLNALQTVGYSEIFNYLEGQLTLDQAIEEIKKNTRHYAKRQMTWFRKDGEIEWLSPSDYGMLEKITEA